MVTKVVTKTPEQNSDEIHLEKESLPKNVYVIAQEIKIIKSLASHDPIVRNKQLKKLQKWLKIRSNSSFPLTEEDFLRLWKGLYFCMWMCDKPLNQEKLADDLGNLHKSFNDIELNIQFFGAFLKIMCLEWFGIDQWRMDKFMMLVRRILRATLEILKDNGWLDKDVSSFNSQLLSTVLETKSPVGLTMHVIDIFLEELGKIANGEISPETVAKFINPFISYLAIQKDMKLLGYVRNRIFYNLLWQSDMGREFMEKFSAWEKMGFPTARIDNLEKVEENKEESESEEGDEKIMERVLDPRAGNIDVFIPPLPVDSSLIIKSMEEIQYKEVTNTKSRRFIKIILERYKKFNSGEFPLGVKKIPKIKSDEPFNCLVEKKIEDLEKLEDTLYGTTRKLKKLNKKKRKKLLASLNFEELNEDTFEEALNTSLTGIKRKLSFSDGWLEEEVSTPDKENSEKNLVSKQKIKNKKNKIKLKKLKTQQQEQIVGKKKSKITNNDNKKMKMNINDIQPTEEKVTTINKQVENDVKKFKSEWDEPLKEGETEYFIPSKKFTLNQFKNEESGLKNKNLLLNPFAKKMKASKRTFLEDEETKKVTSVHIKKLILDENKKRVKFALENNMFQKPTDYVQQVKNSPQLPFDTERKPVKSLLKPNLAPSPINPFYKMIGAKKMK